MIFDKFPATFRQISTDFDTSMFQYSPLRCRRYNVAATMSSLQICHFNVAATMSPLQCSRCNVTATNLPLQCSRYNVASTKSYGPDEFRYILTDLNDLDTNPQISTDLDRFVTNFDTFRQILTNFGTFRYISTIRYYRSFNILRYNVVGQCSRCIVAATMSPLQMTPLKCSRYNIVTATMPATTMYNHKNVAKTDFVIYFDRFGQILTWLFHIVSTHVR